MTSCVMAGRQRPRARGAAVPAERQWGPRGDAADAAVRLSHHAAVMPPTIPTFHVRCMAPAWFERHARLSVLLSGVVAAAVLAAVDAVVLAALALVEAQPGDQ